MSSRLQVGGLALIIKGVSNIGKTVELVEFFDEVHFQDGDRWELAWKVKGDVVNVCGEPVAGGYIQQDRLIPLGDQQTQDELRKEQEELTCKN